MQTGGEDERMSKLKLMRMELEGEVKELEAQLEAKKGALREVRLLSFALSLVFSLLVLFNFIFFFRMADKARDG